MTSGWLANQTELLKPGDYIQVADELKMITAPASSDGDGQATLSFEPALRVSPVDQQPIVLENASCIMSLIDDNQARWRSRGAITTLSFTAIERLV